jgi:hypothetical protein
METVKRVYAKPTILKVQLNHEQAVLALCSTTSGGIPFGDSASPFNCIPNGGCRKCSCTGGSRSRFDSQNAS